MPDRLRSASLKVERAQHHLDAVHSTWASFSKLNPYRIRRSHYDPETGFHTFDTKLIQQPPDNLSLSVGDWAHSLRSALDHIAWAFTTIQDRHTTFPVRLDTPDDGLVTSPERFPDLIRNQIETLQPYRGREPYQSNPLWLVNEFDRIDKHRNILIHGHRLFVPTGLESPKSMFFGNIRRLDEGDVTIRMRPMGDPRENFEPRITAQIQFDMEGPLSIDLAEMRAVQEFFREEVIPRFASLDT